MANLDWMNTSQSVQDENNGRHVQTDEDVGDNPCEIRIYQIDNFQLGTGASGITPKVNQGTLSAPLSMAEYGGARASAPLSKVTVYANEDAPINDQIVAGVYSRGGVDKKIVYVMLLDEHTANDQSLNEIGLFVNNPFNVVTEFAAAVGNPESRSVGGFVPDSDFTDNQNLGAATEKNLRNYPDPGVLLAAYKQFPTIVKEDFFTLLFRWSIRFEAPC